MLEIGPGHGALTEHLGGAGRLVTVEIDRDLVAELQARFPQLDVRTADILRFDLDALLGVQPWRVVGNLPYNISTPVIFHLLGFAERLQDMTFMLQDEVVERMSASPGSRAWGRLALMVQYRCEVHALFRVPPECFRPRPKVTSRIVRLVPRPPAVPADDWRQFSHVVRVAFGQRRKTLRNALKVVLGDRPPPDVGIDWSARPETLDVADFVRLANALGPHA